MPKPTITTNLKPKKLQNHLNIEYKENVEARKRRFSTFLIALTKAVALQKLSTFLVNVFYVKLRNPKFAPEEYVQMQLGTF
jgi:hypothetical protein